MIVLDANILTSQRNLLKNARIASRKIGTDLGRARMTDEEIVVLLHRLAKPTFFSRDMDFFRAELCHDRYCLVWLDVNKQDVAKFVRQFLRHRTFNTKRKRMGAVIHISPARIKVWRKPVGKPALVPW